MLVLAGDTDVTTYFKLRLSATSLEATGLTPADFDLQFVRSGAVPSAKVDATALASVGAAHSDNTVIEVDAVDQPGLYRVDWPDPAFATGVREVILTAKVATAFTEDIRVELSAPIGPVLLQGVTHTGAVIPDVTLVATTTTVTDGALASVATEARLAELDAANIPADVDTILTRLPVRLTRNVAHANFHIFMVQTDGITPLTGATVTGGFTLDLTAEAAFGQAITELANGMYRIDLTAAQTNGLNITYRFSAAGGRDRVITFVTQP